jgi:hypothetical protein
MADGSEKPIREIRIGDLVMAPNGRANRVIDVERPALGARRLYALNGGNFFVTAEHPFMTLAGWKAIDPAATAKENAKLAVSRLQPGDCLTTLQAVGTAITAGNLALAELALAGLALETTVLVHLDSRAADPATPLFNLLLDGDHAYFAEGYLVHNKGGDGGEGGGGGDGGGDGGEGGDDSGGGEGGDDSGSGEGGDDDSDDAESGESGDDSGESGESGDDELKIGESGDDDSEAGDSDPSSTPPSSFGGVEQIGPDLTGDEEQDAISKGWQ